MHGLLMAMSLLKKPLMEFQINVKDNEDIAKYSSATYIDQP